MSASRGHETRFAEFVVHNRIAGHTRPAGPWGTARPRRAAGQPRPARSRATSGYSGWASTSSVARARTRSATAASSW